MSDKNIELQSKIENLMEMDRLLREENINLKSKESHLESKFNMKEKERIRVQELHDKLAEQNERLSGQNNQYVLEFCYSLRFDIIWLLNYSGRVTKLLSQHYYCCFVSYKIRNRIKHMRALCIENV